MAAMEEVEMAMKPVSYSSMDKRVIHGDGNTELEPAFTIDEALRSIGTGWSQVKICFTASLANMYDGMEIMVISILGQVLRYKWHINPWQEAILSLVVLFGWSVGSIIFGKIADKYGRKLSLILGVSWILFYGLLCAAAPSLSWLVILRGLVGLGVGSMSVVTPYFLEFLPTENRGKWSLVVLMPWSFGAIMTISLAILFMPYGWQYWLLMSASPGLVFLFLIQFSTNSPHYELSQGNVKEARSILENLAAGNGKFLPKGKLLACKPNERGDFKKLLSPDYLRTSVLLLCIWCFCIFLYYGAVLFTTPLIQQGNTCHLGHLVTEVSLDECNLAIEPLTVSNYEELLWISAAEVPIHLLTMLLVDVIGRTATAAIMQLIIAALCMSLIICMSRVPMLIILFSLRGLTAVQPRIFYVYVSEVYPTDVRALAAGIASSCSHFSAMFAPFIAQVLQRYFPHASLAVFAGIGALNAILIFLLPIETKDRELTSSSGSSSS